MTWLLILAVFTISLSPVHGQLRLTNRHNQTTTVNHNFTYEDKYVTYHVETTPYSTNHSLEALAVGIFRSCVVLAWEIRPDYHNENWTVTIHHEQSDVKYEFDLTKKGCKVFDLNDGHNTFHFYAKNDNLVGLIAFDLFNALKIEVVPRE